MILPLEVYSEGVARGPISLTLTHASLFFLMKTPMMSYRIPLDLERLSPGLIRLDKFINHTNIDIKRLGQIKPSAIQACKDLSFYCGESVGGDMKLSKYLAVCRNSL